MSDNYSDNKSLKLHEKERNVKLIKNHKCTTVSVPHSKVLQLVSIFENEESETKLKSLSQRRLTTAVFRAEETEKSKRTDEVDGTDDEADEMIEADEVEDRSDHAPAEGASVQSDGNLSSKTASTVSVTNQGGNWIGQRDRNLLFVIHPWCMLHKSSADRQSEFPPPGFLERLKAKLMALHRQSDEQQRHGSAAAAVVCRRRRHTHQRIKCWFQYTATALSGGGTTTAMTTVHATRPRNEPAAMVDFLSVWRRYANVAAACSEADRG